MQLNNEVTPSGPRRARATALVAVLCALGSVLPEASARTAFASSVAPPRTELRGVSISSADAAVFRSRASIAEAMEFLSQHNVNVVFPEVWYRGHTLYPSRVLGDVTGVEQDPRYAGRDPLAELLIEAHVRGIEVIPWYEDGLAISTVGQTPTLLVRKPEWAAIDADGAVVKQGEYVWLNALDPEVQDFFVRMILEMARTYDIDGVQGGERFPALPAEAGYDPGTVELWRKENNRLAPPAPDDERWISWRARRLTNFLAGLSRDLHDVDPHIVLSFSPSPSSLGFEGYLQDSKSWIARGLVDLFHPLCYRREFVNYRQLADEQFAQLPRNSRTVFAPVILIQSGSWRIAAEPLVNMVEHNRDRGYAGEVLAHYSGLRADNGELARALLRGPYAEPAAVPHHSARWRPEARGIAPSVRPGPEAWSREAGHVRALSAGRVEVAYALDAPASGWFRVLLEVPEVDAVPSRIGRAFAGSDVADAWIELSPGLVDLGAVQLTVGSTAIELRIRTADDEKSRLAVGRALILIDRKRSPDAVWR